MKNILEKTSIVYKGNEENLNFDNPKSEKSPSKSDSYNRNNIYEAAEQNRKKWSERKKTSLKIADQTSPYFIELELEHKITTDKERKKAIQQIWKSAARQETCSLHVEYVHAEFKEGWTKKLLDAKRCTNRKSCPICAAIKGMEKVRYLSDAFEYFTDKYSNKREFSDPLKNYSYKKSPVLIYPITISPPNYNSVKEGDEGTKKILKKIFKFMEVTRHGNLRGQGDKCKEAIRQMKDNHIGSFWTKEFELEKNKEGKPTGKINAHWHGILFMHNDGSWKETLNFEYMKEMINQAAGCNTSNMLGDSKNNNKPIEYGTEFTKTLLEVTKYITKMSVKTESEEDFNERQKLIWEVSAQTKRLQFKKGELNNFKQTWVCSPEVPRKVKQQDLDIQRDYSYYSSLYNIDQKYIKPAWDLLMKKELRETQLNNMINAIERLKEEWTEAPIRDRSTIWNKIKYKERREKALHTMISNLNERIETTLRAHEYISELAMNKGNEKERVGNLVIEYQDKYIKANEEPNNTQFDSNTPIKLKERQEPLLLLPQLNSFDGYEPL